MTEKLNEVAGRGTLAGPAHRKPTVWAGLVLIAGLSVLLWTRQNAGRTAAHEPVSPARRLDDAERKLTLQTVPRSQLIQREKLYFRVGETNAFTGVMEDFYDDGALKSRCGVAAGRLDGLSEGWYTNGQMQVRKRFQQGVADGTQCLWFPSGRKQSLTQLSGGKFHGLYQRWHENGALANQVVFAQGKPDGVSRAYYPSGFLKAEVKARQGDILERKTWKDGELKKMFASHAGAQ